MSQAKVIQEVIRENENVFLAICVEMKNAVCLFLSETENQLGTVAIAIPQTETRVDPPLSSILLGGRNMVITRILAEHLAEKMSKTAFVSIFIKTINEREASPILLRLLEKTIEKGDVQE